MQDMSIKILTVYVYDVWQQYSMCTHTIYSLHTHTWLSIYSVQTCTIFYLHWAFRNLTAA